MSITELNQNQKEELATSLAVLTCYDAGKDITSENIQAALTASGNKVATYLPNLFANLISKGINISNALAGPSAGSSSGASVANNSAEAANTSAAVPVKEEKEEEEEADLGGGMDMFGGGSDY